MDAKSGSDMEAVKRYIDANICKVGCIETLASDFNMTASELYERFSRKFGIGPKPYILKCKLKELCRILQTTGDQEIVYYYAHVIGFKTAAGITNFIKRWTGLNFSDFKAGVMSGTLDIEEIGRSLPDK